MLIMLTPALPMGLVPQAILEMDIEKLITAYPQHTVDDTDDFDHFRGIRFKFDNQVSMAILRYDGFPEDTASLYFDMETSMRGEDVITTLVERAVAALELCPSTILWQRRHGENSPQWAAAADRMATHQGARDHEQS